MQYLSYANIFKLICYYVYLVAHRFAKTETRSQAVMKIQHVPFISFNWLKKVDCLNFLKTNCITVFFEFWTDRSLIRGLNCLTIFVEVVT